MEDYKKGNFCKGMDLPWGGSATNGATLSVFCLFVYMIIICPFSKDLLGSLVSSNFSKGTHS